MPWKGEEVIVGIDNPQYTTEGLEIYAIEYSDGKKEFVDRSKLPPELFDETDTNTEDVATIRGKQEVLQIKTQFSDQLGTFSCRHFLAPQWSDWKNALLPLAPPTGKAEGGELGPALVLPPGPLPFSRRISRPRSAARRLASGEAEIRRPPSSLGTGWRTIFRGEEAAAGVSAVTAGGLFSPDPVSVAFRVPGFSTGAASGASPVGSPAGDSSAGGFSYLLRSSSRSTLAISPMAHADRSRRAPDPVIHRVLGVVRPPRRSGSK